MRVLATYRGTVRDFRAWLAAGMPANVVSLAEYRRKRKTAQGERLELNLLNRL